MQILTEYIASSYMTIMLLAGLIVILTANRRTKIEGMQYVWAIIVLVFIMTLCEYMEIWCDTYHKPVWILYLKAAVTYTIHPILILLELYLVAPIKHKFLILLPFFADLILIIADLFGAKLIYSYAPNHSFISGKLHFVPALVLCFYILLLMIYSLEFLRNKEFAKATIVIFITASTLITIFLEFANIITGHTTEIAAMNMLIYSFYLAAIRHSEAQTALYEQTIELEHSKQQLQEQHLKLLLAQIQPHFIYNSIMTLQAQSIGNPIVFEGLRSFGNYLRSNFTAITDCEMIPFEKELKCIKAYLQLERLNYGAKMRVEYDIEISRFMLPALSIEPLVENAVRYGIGTYEQGGLVRIIVRDEPDYIEIEVKDDGSGGNKLTEAQQRRKSIGLENVRLRLKTAGIGELTLSQDETGTSAVVRLKYMEV